MGLASRPARPQACGHALAPRLAAPEHSLDLAILGALVIGQLLLSLIGCNEQVEHKAELASQCQHRQHNVHAQAPADTAAANAAADRSKDGQAANGPQTPTPREWEGLWGNEKAGRAGAERQLGDGSAACRWPRNLLPTPRHSQRQRVARREL